jgi:hypothetical protein
MEQLLHSAETTMEKLFVVTNHNSNSLNLSSSSSFESSPGRLTLRYFALHTYHLYLKEARILKILQWIGGLNQ